MTANRDTAPHLANCRERHVAGSAWTDLGTRHLVSGTPNDRAISIRCQRRAIELLSELPLGEDASYLADLGAAWVNLGCALMVGRTRESWQEALDAFDKAVDLFGRLPFESNARFAHNLAASHMNRAGVSSKIDTSTSRIIALRDYARAIEIAAKLPLDEKASNRILLASCWINLGNLQQRGPAIAEAVHAYESAVEALGDLPAQGHRLACHHAATAWTSKAEAMLLRPGADGAGRAVESAQNALEHVEGKSLDGPVDSKLSLCALRVMARGLEALVHSGSDQRAQGIARLTDVAERGLDIAFGGHETDPLFFDPFVLWFFSFGSRIYGQFQPQFLAEFLGETLARWNPKGDSRVSAELVAIAGQSKSAALEMLGRNRLLIAGERQTEKILSTAYELRVSLFQLSA
jgi:tetratricopeptide (TPR) repeat protein